MKVMMVKKRGLNLFDRYIQVVHYGSASLCFIASMEKQTDGKVGVCLRNRSQSNLFFLPMSDCVPDADTREILIQKPRNRDWKMPTQQRKIKKG